MVFFFSATAWSTEEWCLTGPSLDKSGGIQSPYIHEIETARLNIYCYLLRPVLAGQPASVPPGGITLAELSAALDTLAMEFREFGIFFNLLGTEDVEIDYYHYYSVTPFTHPGSNVSSNYSKPNAINVYFTDPLQGILNAGEAIGGVGSKLIGLSGASIFDAFSHEMGHSLGLQHTFGHSTICDELPDFSNCDICGDYVCDTPAVPVPLNEGNYVDPDSCTLTQDFFDDWPGYYPMATNQMEYCPEQCRLVFTEEQIDRMFAVIETNLFGHQSALTQPIVNYSPPANPQTETGLTYSGVPYSSVTLDFNNDDIDDLFVSISGGPSKLNRGINVGPSGVPLFDPVSAFDFVNGSPQDGLKGLAVGNPFNDGEVILFAADFQATRIYQYDPITQKVENIVSDLNVDSLATDATAVAWADYNQDGFLDLFIPRADGYVEDPPGYGSTLAIASRLLTNVPGPGSTRQFIEAAGCGIPNDIFSISASWADIDGQNGPDLFVGSLFNTGAGGSQLFVNNGNGTFVNETSRLPITPLIGVNGCSWSDMNNDGFLDLVLSFIDQQPAIFFNDGLGFFNDGNGGTAPLRFGPSHGFSGLSVLDFNNDKFLDYLGLSNDVTRSMVLFNNDMPLRGFPNFNRVLVDIGISDLGYAHGMAVKDFGGIGGVPDGIADFFVGRPTSTGKFFFLAESVPDPQGTTPHFVEVRLDADGSLDNSMGIGAIITITAGSHTQAQIVDGGSMRGGQASRDLHFGLGDFDGSVVATVAWPSGYFQTVDSLSIDNLNLVSGPPKMVVDDFNISGTYTVNPNGSVNWIFSWETNIDSDPDLDEVVFNLPAIPPQCQPSNGFVKLGMSPDVSLAISPAAQGGFTHVMTWANRPCVPKCTIPFWVTSAEGINGASSNSTADLRVRVCINN